MSETAWDQEAGSAEGTGTHEGPGESNSFCAGCGLELDRGAVICISCGYDTRLGRALRAKTLRAKKAGDSAAGSRISIPRKGPTVAAVAYLLIVGFAIVAGLAGGESGVPLLLGAYGGTYLLSIALHITATVVACAQSGALMGIVVFFVPFASLWYAVARCEYGYVKLLLPTCLLANIAVLVAIVAGVGVEALPQP